jgi:8-oxo-dGTP diphosphatase
LNGTPRDRTLKVVAGILSREGRFLVCQRRGDGAFPHKWEFPGGKMEPGEDADAALRRELREELDIAVESAREVFRHAHVYADGTRVELAFFEVRVYGGEPRNRVFRRIAWVPVHELEKLDFLGGDLPLIHELRNGGLEGLSQRKGLSL